MNNSLILLGAGGHASVLADILEKKGIKPNWLSTPQSPSDHPILKTINRLTEERVILNFPPENTSLINGIGSLPGQTIRASIFEKFKKHNYQFESIISKDAIISPYAYIGEGVQVMPGAIIQAGAVIGDNSIINTGAIIDHDSIIGKHNHIAPGATLSGSVTTEDNVHIGTGASIIQSIIIGQNSIISAGCSITKNVIDNVTIYCARTVQKENKNV